MDSTKASGVLVAPRVVLTSGYVLFMKNSGWTKSVRVTPGLNGTQLPFGSVVSNDFRTTMGWIRDQKPEDDFGAIILPEPLGDKAVFYT